MVHHLSGIFIQTGGVHHLSGTFIHMGGGVHHLSGIFIQSKGVHHLSGIFIQRGVYTISVEYLSRARGCTTSVEYLSRGGVYTTSVEYLSTWGGGCTTSVEYLSRGGGTPPQWNINPQGGGVHHLSGIFFPASHFPQCPIFPPFFFFWGGCSPLLHGLPFFPTFNFHDGFFSGGWLCWGRGSARLFLVSL